MRIIVTGTLAYDHIMEFSGVFSDRIMPEKIDSLSLSFLVDTLRKQFGGTGGNIAYSLQLLGNNPILAAPVGNDFALYQEFLQTTGINTSHIAVHNDVATSAYFVVTDSRQNQIGSFYLGASKYMKDIHVSDIVSSEAIDKKEVFVLLSPTDPIAMNSLVGECLTHDFAYMYDPAFQIANFSEEELRLGIGGAKILIGNDYEIALIAKRLNIEHEALVRMVSVVVTTLGEKGSIVETKDNAVHIKPTPVAKAIDPTGAGDAYRSGFMAGYSLGFDLVTCGNMGSVAAACTVERHGTQTHSFTIDEFCARYKSVYGSSLRLS